MAHDALETVKLRNDFYRDSYRKVTTALLVALLAIVALAGTVVYVVSHRPTPKYFATTESGRIIPLIPLSQPNINAKAIREWATEAATSLYSYNFVNYRKAFSENEKYFTGDGWQAFLKQLQQTGNLQAVQDKKLIVSAVPTGVPVIQNQGVYQGRYVWRVQLPILVNYEGQGANFHNNLLVTLTIERISTLTRDDGIGIKAFVAQEQS